MKKHNTQSYVNNSEGCSMFELFCIKINLIWNESVPKLATIYIHNPWLESKNYIRQATEKIK